MPVLRLVFASLAGSVLLMSFAAGEASAQLAGADRNTFVEASAKSCSEALSKSRADLDMSVVTSYCVCMANGQADMTTMDDVTYMNAHNAVSDDYRRRVMLIVPRCKASSGLK